MASRSEIISVSRKLKNEKIAFLRIEYQKESSRFTSLFERGYSAYRRTLRKAVMANLRGMQAKVPLECIVIGKPNTWKLGFPFNQLLKSLKRNIDSLARGHERSKKRIERAYTDLEASAWSQASSAETQEKFRKFIKMCRVP